MKFIIRAFIFVTVVILITLLFSCSPTYHIKRARAKDPSLFEMKKEVVIDTVWKTVETVDTLFKYTTDTVFITKDSVKIKYYYSYQDSLVYIEADCPDCPSVTRTETQTETVFIEPTFWDKLKWFLSGVVGTSIIAVFLRVFRVI